MTAYPDAESFSEARKMEADYVEKGPRLEALIDQIMRIEPGTVYTHLKRASKKLHLSNLLDYIID